MTRFPTVANFELISLLLKKKNCLGNCVESIKSKIIIKTIQFLVTKTGVPVAVSPLLVITALTHDGTRLCLRSIFFNRVLQIASKI